MQVKRKREAWVEADLEELDRSHLRRMLRAREPDPDVIDLSTNDYLGLSTHPAVVAAACAAAARSGVGARASRLVAGTLPMHEAFEAELARHKGYPAALLFGSGFLANAGLLPALVSEGDTILADKLCHASLLDGARLSGAKLQRFRHNDPDHLVALLDANRDARRLAIATESVFSMDGDLAPLATIARIAEERGAMLVVDEAHATGVFGPAGAGCIAAERLQESVNVSMFTLSKALGGYGGGVACSTALRNWFVTRARAFIYTTALPPPVVAAGAKAVELLEANPDWGPTLLARAERLRQRLRAGGLDTLHSRSQIVPVLIGDVEKTLRVAARLRAERIEVAAIRPPTVPPGTARLRLSLTLAHDDATLDRVAANLLAAVHAEGIA